MHRLVFGTHVFKFKRVFTDKFTFCLNYYLCELQKFILNIVRLLLLLIDTSAKHNDKPIYVIVKEVG